MPALPQNLTGEPMKRFLLWSILLILLLAAAGAFVLTRVDTGFVATTISDAVNKATGAPVTFTDPPRLSLYPLGVDFGRLAWKREQADKSLAVSAAGGHARVALSPLFSGNIVVEEITLTGPALDIVLHAPAAGTPHEEKEAVPSAQAPAAADADVPSDVLPLELRQVRVEQARINFTDAVGNRLGIDGLHLDLKNVRRHADMTVDTGFSYSLSQGGQDISGSFALKATVRYQAPNLTVRDLQLGLTPKSGPLPEGLGPLALQGEAALNFATRKLRLQNVALACASSRAELSGEADLGSRSFAGALSLVTAPRALAALWGVRLPQQGEDRLEVSTGLECSPSRVALHQLKAARGKTHLEGSLDLSLRPDTAIRGNLRLNDIVIEHYLPEEASPTTAAAPASPSDGKGTERVTSSTTTDFPTLDVSLAVDSLRYKKMGVQGLALRLQGEKGRYRLRDLRCRLACGGAVAGTGSADLPQKRYALSLKADDVDIGGLTQMLGKGRPADGKAWLTADLSAAGESSENLMASLDGKGALEVRDLHLQALSALPRDIPGVSGAIPKQITRVQVPFVVRQGEVNAKPIVASSDALNANGQATASLPRKRLHATADVRTLGLTIPVIIDGPFDDLSYTVDPRFLARMATSLPGALLEGGTQAGKTAGETAKGAGSVIDKTVRGASGLMRGILGR